MTTSNDQREAAIRRLRARQEFRTHLGVFLLVNTMLVIIWAATGAGYFWPIWPIAGWAIGLASHAFTVFFNRPLTEDQIQAEINRHGPQDTVRH